ncbi:ABC transporter A family member 12 [Tetrabaena socialis]|uniref:ABC transporter A family member 12 n=1 Tax=Tetrabaena socialis TaxID=47790 RepID=A0A2J8AG25_9CHLO|nr:ABC transporter A family member 12 [Tetrabaena socialis]|eukprot:PNH11475.1 ABC transporter A family member 12 [Tetrabaena socialis]
MHTPQTATFGAQANALLRKSATYQKRNVRTNICLLSSPIFFCVILLIIKLLINNVFLSGPDFECGCKCMQCCRNGQNCRELQQGFCDTDQGYECKRFDKDKCGLAYSSSVQASWCEVKDPSSWPPVVQVPRWWRRAKPARPGVTQLLAAPSSAPSFTAADLNGYIYTRPSRMDRTAFLQFLEQLITANGTVNGHLFTKAGFTFGTSAPGGQQKYIESAFSASNGLDLLLPNVGGLSCAALGVNFTSLASQGGPVQPAKGAPVNQTRVTAPLINVLIAFVQFSSGTTVTEAEVLAVLGSRPVVADFLEQDTSCTDVVMAPVATGGDIDTLLYCGFYQARCNGTPIASEYPPALEFSAASAASLSVSVFYNDTDADGGGGPSNYLRVQRTLSGAVSAWWANMPGGTQADDVQLLGVMSMPKSTSKLKLDFSNLLGPLFYTCMNSIYRLMGVCPQHDLLWEQLTGEEHLLFYGRLKGLKGPVLLGAVASGLKSVNLANGGVGQKQSQKYSGGMKRRLSVAISFIGDPQVVYLDEPSTGLDPASRRNLWDVVRGNKEGRAIILTTHSMEEAEILCDRLGIFVDGQLVCIGNPREITARYAGYFVFTLTVGHGHEEAAKAFVSHMSPNCRLTYALGSTVKYELPTADITLSGVFDAMATAKTQMEVARLTSATPIGSHVLTAIRTAAASSPTRWHAPGPQVLDWGVANATLEEVFIKFARQIGAETNEQ